MHSFDSLPNFCLFDSNYDDFTGDYGRVSVDLDGLGLIPVGAPATFTIMVAGGDDAELAVSVQGRPNVT